MSGIVFPKLADSFNAVPSVIGPTLELVVGPNSPVAGLRHEVTGGATLNAPTG